MSNYSKSYIGKGRQHKNLNIVTVTLSAADLEKHIYEYEGQRLITFELATLKQPDQYGKTHTAYVIQKEQEVAAVQEPAAKPKAKRSKK